MRGLLAAVIALVGVMAALTVAVAKEVPLEPPPEEEKAGGELEEFVVTIE